MVAIVERFKYKYDLYTIKHRKEIKRAKTWFTLIFKIAAFIVFKYYYNYMYSSITKVGHVVSLIIMFALAMFIASEIARDVSKLILSRKEYNKIDKRMNKVEDTTVLFTLASIAVSVLCY